MAPRQKRAALERQKVAKEVLEHWQPPAARTVRLQSDPPSGQPGPLALELWHHKKGWEEHFPPDWYTWLPLDDNLTVIARGQREVFVYRGFQREKTAVLDVAPVDYPGPFALAGNWMFKMLRLSKSRWLLSAPTGAPPGDEPWMALSLMEQASVVDRMDWPQRPAAEGVHAQPCDFRMVLACDGRVLVAREFDDLYVVGLYGDRLKLIAHDTMPSRGLLQGNGVNVWVSREVGLAKYQWWQLTNLEDVWRAHAP